MESFKKDVYISKQQSADFENKKSLLIVLIIFIFIAFFISVYFSFFYYNLCPDFSCYKQSLISCKRVDFIRDGSDAIWKYTIRGSKNKDMCRVEVTLLLLKEGSVDVEELNGKSMLCDVFKNSGKLPEENMESCTGKLKEELQEIIIGRMHEYLVKNVDNINEEFKGIGSIALNSSR